jgi:hypothetical protein
MYTACIWSILTILDIANNVFGLKKKKNEKLSRLAG